MSRKYLLILFFLALISLGAVCASDNSTDEVISSDCDDGAEALGSADDCVLANGEDEMNYEDYYHDAVLKASNLTTTYNSGKTFKVKAVSASDSSFNIDNMKLKLRVYTKGKFKEYSVKTGSKGIAEFKGSKLSVGLHKVIVIPSDSYTAADNITGFIKIKKANTKVSAPKLTAKYKKSKTFRITVKDKATKKAVKGAKISVKVGKKKYTLTTNKKGVASFKTKSLASGKYKVIIKSKDSRYKVNAKSSIRISK
jgi:hypothetical protein